MSQEVNRKLSCILSADVVGYSRLMEENEASTVRYLEENKKLITSLIEDHNGRVVDSPGDNMLAEFGSAVKAVDCAVKIQKELKIRNAELVENRRMQFRIGINLGDVIEEDGRLYGSGVNIAARLEGLAQPGGICISRNVYDQVKTKLDLAYEYLGEHDVKNISEPVRVYRVQTGIVNAESVTDKKVHVGLSGKIAIAATLIIIVAGLLVWRFYPNQRIKTGPEPIETRQKSGEDQEQKTLKSIAVLPFENLSSDPEQEYFSDGLTEELINKLSHVKGLQVTARTSSFYFKGKNEDMRTIGEKLGVSYLLEGSVRKSENQLRITAQLIKAEDGYHLFSKTYERELKDIFAIQDEIAKEVTTALSVVLGAGEFNFPGMTRNIEAYDEILRARSALSSASPQQAIDHAKRALDIDPGFGIGWYTLSGIYNFNILFLPPEQIDDYKIKSAEALEHARTLAPDMPELLLATANEHRDKGNWLKAEHIFKQLFDQRGHTDFNVNIAYGKFLLHAKRNGEAIFYLKHAKQINPLDLNGILFLALSLLNAEKTDEALAEIDYGKKLQEYFVGFIYVEYLAALQVNDPSKAASIFKSYYALDGSSPDPIKLRLASLLTMEDKKVARTELREISKRSDLSPNSMITLAHVAFHLGDSELALESFVKSGHNNALAGIWCPMNRSIWQLPAFKTYIREIGLYNYWRSSGNWGDNCRPIGEDDFVCD